MKKKPTIKSISHVKKRATNLVDYQRKLNYLRAYEIVPFKSWKKISPQQKRWITVNYRRVTQLSIDNLSEFKPIKSKKELKRLIDAGYRHTRRGVVIPKVVSGAGIPLKNQKREIDKRGRTVTRVGKRRDIDIYFTSAQRRKIAKRPELLQSLANTELKKLKLKKGEKTQLNLIYKGGLNRIVHSSARNWSMTDSDRKNAKYIIGMRLTLWAKKKPKRGNSKR